ncbi:hypothetical protein Isop_3694 [Isosphaera pallida ATCC 43644]|uniref:DUF4340 domain-containing protein n=1 Tax=Isosphaera pallida (strain ATCC 43644 / DSM 9630 / IS1B) TaxID=575540 RepID=E8QZC1_ISOPI|nr:DUF4340 domain-containing protein [Isosphaera pallida]ADV64250.1 hypothetical protein Isop_3694 [Isosphaera pallida ATCC 43644]
MNELQRTLVYVVVALALLATAAYVRMPPTIRLDVAADEGQPFFPEFTDPLAAGALEVVEYNPREAKIQRFRVVNTNGVWTIPTHSNYPADARDRLAKTAGAVIGLTKDQFITNDPRDFPKLGLLAPDDPEASSIAAASKGKDKDGEDEVEGDPRGKLITISKADGGPVLASFIIGKPVPNREGFRYVRLPDSKSAYAVRVEADISTKFSDWIETNLLQLDTSRVVKLEFNRNHFDETRTRFIENGQPVIDLRRGMIPGEVFQLTRLNPGDPWQLSGLEIPQGRELDTAKTNTILSALSDVKIVGVRTKPANLKQALDASDKTGSLFVPIASIDEAFLSQLAAIGRMSQGRPAPGEEPADESQGREPTGFMICYKAEGPNRNQAIPFGVLPTQSSVRIGTSEGVVYNLFFGEPLFAQGTELEAGGADDRVAPVSTENQGENAEANSAGSKSDADAGRFLFVSVEFDESLLPPPPPPPAIEPDLEQVVFEDPFQTDELPRHPIRDQRRAAEDAAKQREKDLQEQRRQQIEAGRKRVEQLGKRFANWYYVTRGDSFKQIAVAPTDLLKAPSESGSDSQSGSSVPGSSSNSDFGLDDVPAPNAPGQ